MSSDDFVEELRIQSVRDLDEARFILDKGSHLDHVAWFCEQSYEKLVKHVYSYYKLKIQNRSLNKVYSTVFEAQHYDSPHLILRMLSELTREFFQIYMNGFNQLGQMSENDRKILTDAIVSKMPQNAVGMNDKFLDSIKKKIDACLWKKDEFEALLKNSSYESLYQNMKKFDYDALIEQNVSKYTQGLGGLSGADPSQLGWATSSKLYKDYYLFVTKLLVLAPWILPHVSASRYPLIESGFVNLKLYRELESQLKPYFDHLVSILQSLQKQKDDFILTLDTIHKFANKV